MGKNKVILGIAGLGLATSQLKKRAGCQAINNTPRNNTENNIDLSTVEARKEQIDKLFNVKHGKNGMNFLNIDDVKMMYEAPDEKIKKNIIFQDAIFKEYVNDDYTKIFFKIVTFTPIKKQSSQHASVAEPGIIDINRPLGDSLGTIIYNPTLDVFQLTLVSGSNTFT